MLELSLRQVLTAYRHANKRIINGDFLYIEFSWCWTNYGSGRLRVCELSGRPGCSGRYIGNAPRKEAMAKLRWRSLAPIVACRMILFGVTVFWPS
jgi:hypothetical protein